MKRLGESPWQKRHQNPNQRSETVSAMPRVKLPPKHTPAEKARLGLTVPAADLAVPATAGTNNPPPPVRGTFDLTPRLGESTWQKRHQNPNQRPKRENARLRLNVNPLPEEKRRLDLTVPAVDEIPDRIDDVALTDRPTRGGRARKPNWMAL
jgi:hypothetical protein